MKHLERIANIAVIVAVVVFIGLAIRGDFSLNRTARTPSSQDLVGRVVKLSGVSFPSDRNTLVLAVSTTCHFCKDSLPFYKQLTNKVQGRLNVVAVLPETQQDAQKFLRDADVETNQVVSSSLDVLGVHGTPTILLVDGTGKVSRAWVGRLDQKGQEDLQAVVLPGAPS